MGCPAKKVCRKAAGSQLLADEGLVGRIIEAAVAAVPIPVTIKCEPATLYRGSPWWNVPERRFTYSVTVGEPLAIKDALPDDLPEGFAARPRRARALTRTLQNYFERRVVLV